LEPLRPTSKPAARRLQELLACHKRFCDLQLANKKTSRVLEAAFDAEFTQQYMEQVRLFNSSFGDGWGHDGTPATLSMLSTGCCFDKCFVLGGFYLPSYSSLDLQLANKKTSRVLEAAFNAEFTQQYMEQVRSMEPPVSKFERACV
jgi:hypothetical protein